MEDVLGLAHPMKMNTVHSKLDGICVHYIKTVVFLISIVFLSLYQGNGLHIRKRNGLIK